MSAKLRKGPERESCEEQLGWLSLEKRREDNSQEGAGGGQDLLPGIKDRRRGHSLRLCQERFSWNIRKNFCTAGVVKH